MAVVYSVESEREVPLRLSTSRAQRRALGRLGIGMRVGFVPLPPNVVLPNRIVPRRLKAKLPPHRKGALVHLIDLRDCRPGSHVKLSQFDLRVAQHGDDPHTALVDVTVSAGKHELWSYARAADHVRVDLRCP